MNKANRLIDEKSPYLLQHARNPVDWYPWGEAAFEKAREEEKAIFLSIGYSTCHWCHVMERESFCDPSVAAILNDNFVSIKVDREERPDIDAAYMTAVQLLTGRGGWPLSVFITPDGKPFYGGTYFPPEDRWGMPGFRTVLLSIADAWKNNREKVLSSGDSLAHLVQRQSARAGTGGGALTGAVFDDAAAQLSRLFDREHGGFGPAPKFPMAHMISFLLRRWRRSGDGRALEMAEKTLDGMARGGIYDRIGGGFHRYSTDGEWRVPHFEKMLYDQAMLSRVYLEAYQATGEKEYARTAREVLDYVLRVMADPGGGFYSAEDADSLPPGGAGGKREGAFYVWTKGEIEGILGEEEGRILGYACGVRDPGNAPSDPHGEFAGMNILYGAHTVDETAAHFGIRPDEAAAILDDGRKKLLEEREKRPRPHLDDKILTDWNGLVVGSLAIASRALGEGSYLEAAEKAADFVLSSLRREDGRLLHRYREGEAAIPAYLEDYAFFVDGLIELYQASFDPRYLEEAVSLSESMVDLFGDGGDGGLFSTGRDTKAVLARKREGYDGAIPSGNSVAALDLLRAGRLTARPDLEARGRSIVKAFTGDIAEAPTSHAQMLAALDFSMGPTMEIVIAGGRGAEDVAEMARLIGSRYIPNTVVIFHGSGHEGVRVEALAPYVTGMVPADGRAAAYVCANYSCSLPAAGPAELGGLLDREGGKRLPRGPLPK